MEESAKQYAEGLSESASVQYEVPISQPREIWDMKFDDCLKRLNNSSSELYEDIEDMRESTEFYSADPCPEMRYNRGVIETSDRFESALENAEEMFEYSTRSYDFSHHSEAEELSNDHEDFWWIIHHLQTMKNKAE